MLNNDISESMKQSVEKILDKVEKTTNVYNVTMTFTSSRAPDLRVELCREIVSVKIEQDFIQNYSDKITVELDLTRDEYITLYYMRKDLACQFSFGNVYPDRTEDSLTPEELKSLKEETLNFKAVVTKYEDIFKKVSSERLYPEYSDNRDETDQDRMRYKMTVELIDGDVYKARKMLINAVYVDVKIEDVIKTVINKFGFDQAMIIKPDNDKVYTNFVIPPSQPLDSIMGFLQTSPGHGIYSNGLVSYITRWWKDMQKMSWFVYPRYAAPLAKNIVHVYSTGQNMYTGLNCNHWTCPAAGTSILCSDELDIKNYSDLGSENQADGTNVLISDAILDGTRILIADDNAKTKSRASDHVVVPTDPMDMKEMVRADFKYDNGNLFAIDSDLRAYQSSHVNFKWRYAKPWTLTPGTEVQVHYDHPLGFKTIKGMAERVVYTLRRDENNPINLFFVCTAEVTVNYDNVQEPDKSHV